MPPFTIVTLEGASTVSIGGADGRVRVPADGLAEALGWKLEPEGFCFENVCYPVPEDSGMVDDDGVDLEAFAALIGRPLAIDRDEGAAFVGASAQERMQSLMVGQAPDFTLPDLDGNLHSLSDHRGEKVLLAVYASW